VTEEPDDNYSFRFNKPPDEKFRMHFRHICMRPAMYVGKESFELTATLLEGMALGYQDWHGGFMHSLLHEEFQQFLAKKYRKGMATFKSVAWSAIIPRGMKLQGLEPTEKQMIDRLLQDFEDYNNILTRLAIETK
jgi:hypothetical protein